MHKERHAFSTRRRPAPADRHSGPISVIVPESVVGGCALMAAQFNRQARQAHIKPRAGRKVTTLLRQRTVPHSRIHGRVWPSSSGSSGSVLREDASIAVVSEVTFGNVDALFLRADVRCMEAKLEKLAFRKTARFLLPPSGVYSDGSTVAAATEMLADSGPARGARGVHVFIHLLPPSGGWVA